MSKIHILMTGSPGVGKTTLVKSISNILKQDGLVVHGFYTEELRVQGVRVGFDVVTIDGQRAPLSRTTSIFSGQPRVGRYMVDVGSFESISLPAIEVPCLSDKVVMVIDEIGKMEMFSSRFQQAVKNTFSEGNCVVMATIPEPKRSKSIPLVQMLVGRHDTEVYHVIPENRDSLIQELVGVVKNSISALN